MEVRRTVPVKLRVSDDAAEKLRRTFDQFKQAANYVVAHAEDDDGYIITGKQRLHDRTYEDVRQLTDLHANMVQAARSRAADALNSVTTKWENGKFASLPTFTSDFAEYDKRSATFHDDHASLSTVDGRVEIDYDLPDSEETPHAQYLENDAYEVTGATLHHRDGAWYLHLRAKTEVESPVPERDGEDRETVLGVDLNVTGGFAVTSTGAFIGSADYLTHRRDQYEQVRAGLQETGTQSAHRTLGRVGAQFAQWSEDWLHRKSNELLEHAQQRGCSTIVFEDLTDIRDRMSDGKKFQQWAFKRFAEYVAYKAEAVGIAVVQIKPQYTSQRCSHPDCGFTHEDNRDGDDFACLKCGYELNADYNAAKNIAKRYVRHGHTSRGGRAPRQCALKSGTVTGTGTHQPAD